MTGGLAEEGRAMLDGSALRIGRGEIKPPDASEGNGGRAHGTWFEGDVEIAIGQALRAEFQASRTDHEHLGMSGRVVAGKRAIAIGGDDDAVAHDNSPHRHLAARGCRASLVECTRQRIDTPLKQRPSPKTMPSANTTE